MKTLSTLFTMSVLVIVILTLVITSLAEADVYVRGHYRNNGTYVRPHYRSNPDGNPHNNWSTYPNINPYTGKRGTKRYSAMDGIDLPSYKKPVNLPGFTNNRSWQTPNRLPDLLPGPTYPNKLKNWN